jgi:orotate phosphoribosyltransferase
VKEQEAPSPVRVPWNAFPDVIVHSSIYRLKCLPAYYAAKRGDHKAASQIARALVKTENIPAVDFVVPVIQVDCGRYNAIPVAVGAVLAKRMGARLWLDVCQINKVDHTDAGAEGRLQNQPIFGGLPPRGKCLICDDVVTYGATLANLRGFLISTGAEVLAATAIGAAYGSTKLAPELSLIVKLRRLYGDELERCTETLGFGSDCLTAREAHFFAGMRTVERIRDCLAQRVGSTNRSRSISI